MRLEVWTLFLRLWELRGRGIGGKVFLRFYFRRSFFLRRAGDSPPYRSRLGRNRLHFLHFLGKGKLDAGEIEGREDIRMRRVFEIGDQCKGDEPMKEK